MRHLRSMAALCCAAFLLPLATRAAAQGSGPLNKSDLIRMLSVRSLSPQEVAVQVGLRCVNFVPTARDLVDLKVAGADSAILHTIATCARSGGAVRIALPAGVRAAAGTQVAIAARLVRGTVPQPGIRLLLRGVRALSGGTGRDPTAVTDRSGVARFRIRAATRAGTYPLEVVATSDTGGVRGFVDLTVTAAAAARADVSPADLVFVQGGQAPIAVRVEVWDGYRNPVIGAPVELRRLEDAPIPEIAAAVTDSQGAVTIAVPPGAEEGQLSVVSAGRRLARLSVRYRAVVLSAAESRFSGGADQGGGVGTELPQPLVFVVRDQSRAPVPGYEVTFTATNATVAPATALSDARGEVAVRVTLGERAGPALVTAHVGEFTREAALYAVPGDARELVVQRAGVPLALADTLAIRTREPVTLRVGARDAYGNAVLTGDVTVSATGDAVRAGTGQPYGPPRTVVLEAQRSGTAVVTIAAAGLEVRVPVDVAVPGVGGWMWGARAGGALFDYDSPASAGTRGWGGFRGELFGGRQLPSGLRFAVGLGGGVLGATTGGGEELFVMLWQGSLRAEYALLREARVVPVVALGGGGYRLKSTEPGAAVYHTSVFWTGGAGVDVPLSRRLVGEVRVSAQRLVDATSGSASGGVAWLTVFEAGVRVAP